eukprot:TRINITY_DN11214_c0_g1_i3.p1 TRINITY_DN11214_c0_g1~~TRINITY_DN11214_c0_g1_i3.p1  ORF type:complete len:1041 (+),score=146.91 TRINITY_DN11214_c0_g1_i3:151-3273(+)
MLRICVWLVCLGAIAPTTAYCIDSDVIVILDTASALNSSEFSHVREQLALVAQTLDDTAHRLSILTTRPAHIVFDYPDVSNATLVVKRMSNISQFNTGLRLSPPLRLISSYHLNRFNPLLRNDTRLQLLLLMGGTLLDVVDTINALQTIRTQHPDTVVTTYSLSSSALVFSQVILAAASKDTSIQTSPSSLNATMMAKRIFDVANCSAPLVTSTSAATTTTVTSTAPPSTPGRPQLIPNSCRHRCLTTLVAGSCFCDEACSLVNDCCSDFARLCVPSSVTTTPASTSRAASPTRASSRPSVVTSSTQAKSTVATPVVGNSCSGRCDIGVSRDLSCYCEASCVQAKDCCPDATDFCFVDNSSSTTASASSTSITSTSVSTPPSSTAALSPSSTAVVIPCQPGQSDCHACQNNSCVQCRNQRYLLDGVCVAQCPSGSHRPQGTGNFNRQCVALTTPSPTTPKPTCVAEQDGCFICSLVQTECLICYQNTYLHLGACVAQCPPGYLSNGTGFYGRMCELPAAFAAPSGYTLVYQGKTIHNTHAGAEFLRFSTALDSSAQVFSARVSLQTCTVLCSSLLNCKGIFAWTKTHNNEHWCAGLSDLGRAGGSVTSLEGYSLRKDTAAYVTTTMAVTSTSTSTTSSTETTNTISHTMPVTTTSTPPTVLTTTAPSTTSTVSKTSTTSTSGVDPMTNANSSLSTSASFTTSVVTSSTPSAPVHACELPLILFNGQCVKLCPPVAQLTILDGIAQCIPRLAPVRPASTRLASLTVPETYQCLDGRTSFDQSACKCQDPNCLICQTSRSTTRCLVCQNSRYLSSTGACMQQCNLTIGTDQSAPVGRKCLPAQATSPVVGFCTAGRDADRQPCSCGSDCLACVIMSDGKSACMTCTNHRLLHASKCVRACPPGFASIAQVDGIGSRCARPLTASSSTPSAPVTSSSGLPSSAQSPDNLQECLGRTVLGTHPVKLCTCGSTCYRCHVDTAGANVRCLQCFNSTYLYQGACVSHCSSGKRRPSWHHACLHAPNEWLMPTGLEPMGNNDRGRVCS